MARDLKYLFSFVVPASTAMALYGHGIWSWSPLLIAFVLVPLLELFMSGTTENFDPDTEALQEKRNFFDYLLYVNIPLQFGLLGWYLWQVGLFANGNPMGLSSADLVGRTLSVGVFLGACLNIAHELGHRDNKAEQFLARLMLMTNLYMHFFVEHNRGHHVHIATDRDPASSRLNEWVYTFWFRSMLGGLRSAWSLEARRLAREGKPVFSIHNEVLVYQFIQAFWLLAIGLVLGSVAAVLGALAVGFVSILMLETVNYIEHYGLRRQLLPSGKYERVQPWHSWNSNHPAGRILLFELTRHSDHHYKASRKYQILRHFDEAPQLPLGYPGSMLLALLPPLWFAVMNPRVRQLNAAPDLAVA